MIRIVFCPKCGNEHSEYKERCDQCGEILREEVNLNRAIRIINSLIFILVTGTLITAFLAKSELGIGIYVIIMLILLAVYFILDNKRFKKFLYAQLIKHWFNGARSKQCPQCENYVAEDKYCLSCGYYLEPVVGYYKTEGILQPTYIELNRKYIRVFKTLRTRYSFTRLEPIQYNMIDIENQELTWCGRLLTTSRCFRFIYEGRQIKIYNTPSLALGLYQIFPDLKDNRGKGRFVWIYKQNKKRYAVFFIIILLIVLPGVWYFTAKTEIPITSLSSNEPGLEIKNATAYRMEYAKNSISIAGIVWNYNSSSTRFLRMNAIGLDQNGNRVDNQSFYVDLQSIPIGHYSRFDYFLDDYTHAIVSVKMEIIKNDFYS